MKCPQCNFEETKVLESRLSNEGRAVRRRRQCLSCGYRYTTYEKEEEFIFQVKKRDGRTEPYEHKKVLDSIQIACRKRPINIEQIESLIASIERRIQEEGRRTVESSRLGDMILDALHEIDKVAYVRFASVYKDFKDPKEFMNALNTIR